MELYPHPNYKTNITLSHKILYVFESSWLRLYATSRKVTGSIPDVNVFFNWSNPFSRNMSLGSTQPLSEMSTRNIPGGRGLPVRKADHTDICEPIVY
jgi:hypothetical protein